MSMTAHTPPHVRAAIDRLNLRLDEMIPRADADKPPTRYRAVGKQVQFTPVEIDGVWLNEWARIPETDAMATRIANALNDTETTR